MKKIILICLIVILLAAVAQAQIVIPKEEKTTCGDGIREGHEMCEPDTEQDLCEQAGKVIGIVMACDPRDCTCVPDRMDCGNEIREGSEFCDPGKKEDVEENDFCDELGAVFNETFTCDEKTCMCKPEKAFGYEKEVCGDGKITGNETCEKDSDCRADQECKSCDCAIRERDIKEIKKELENDTIPLPTPVKEEGFDYHDLVGTAIPEFMMNDFDEEAANIHVSIDDKTQTVIGVRTMYGVVQEIVDDGLDDPGFDVYVTKTVADEIINAQNKTQALEKAFEDEDITYKPRGFFKKIFFWFKSLFR